MAAMRAERLPTVEILACLWLCALLSIVVEALLWAVRARAKGDQQEAVGSSLSRGCNKGCCCFDKLAAYWSAGPQLCYPRQSLKLAVLLLLTIDLLGLTAPEVNLLSVPEVVNISRSHPHLPQQVIPLTRYFMPDISPSNATAVAAAVARLESMRWLLLYSWGAYLALPSPTPIAALVSSSCYIVGAACYVLLGSLSLMYGLGHSSQTSLLFVGGASFCVHDLGRNPRASTWLRQYLLLGILASSFLCAGLSKLRYSGLEPLLSGVWLVRPTSYNVFATSSLYTRRVASPCWKTTPPVSPSPCHAVSSHLSLHSSNHRAP